MRRHRSILGTCFGLMAARLKPKRRAGIFPHFCGIMPQAISDSTFIDPNAFAPAIFPLPPECHRELPSRLTNLPPCLIGMEAERPAGQAHYSQVDARSAGAKPSTELFSR